MSAGLLLFAHGARDPAWAGPFQAVVASLAAQQPGLVTRLAFLEFMSPGLEEAARQLVAAGCSRIDVVPLFLGSSGHVRREVPPLVEALRQQHGPAVRWRLHEAIGEHPLVVAAMATATLDWLKN
ncbi:CbiX/SirB N-terminal domain-containing protein [Pelomonas sp. SE-A7]|uniref:sirohydrochlorin chelatase n=1 Tax=Pelomonas sp. SE-A7 TaxID=3054953 RepID=UPI00259C8971|nr:CbiX/SirB N-terminal domain-containing protein [Pelomonas sp. SE-A7]MDM4764852.1 CbiX/SirB N-terminal domain-containing protein [Pelomonas sp. SE-A7]